MLGNVVLNWRRQFGKILSREILITRTFTLPVAYTVFCDLIPAPFEVPSAARAGFHCRSGSMLVRIGINYNIVDRSIFTSSPASIYKKTFLEKMH